MDKKNYNNRRMNPPPNMNNVPMNYYPPPNMNNVPMNYYLPPHLNVSMNYNPPTPMYYPVLNQPNMEMLKDEPLDKPSAIQTTTTESNTTTTTTLNLEEEAIKLQLNLKRTTIQSSSFNSQSFPLLVSLSVENLKTTSQRVPVDLVCVIDQSRSMEGQKITLVKQAFASLLNFLGDSDRLSIICFNTSARLVTQLIRTKAENKIIIMDKLEKIPTVLGTNILSGLDLAFSVLKSRQYKNPVSSIFLLTDGRDGQAKTAEKTRQRMLAQKLDNETTIHTFGFGEDHDPKLMSDISGLRDGNFYFLDQLDTVDEAFVDCLGGLLSSIGQNVTLKVKGQNSDVLNGVKITKTYGESAMWNNTNGTFTTHMSSLITGSQKDFVLELEIPPNLKELTDEQKNIKVASAEVDITDLNGNHIVKKADLQITLLNELEETKETEEDNKEVTKHFYRLKSASILDEARKLADINDFEKAKKLLQNLNEELLNCSLKNEQFIIHLTQDVKQAMVNIEPKMYKIGGKHGMYESVRAQFHQRSNLRSFANYQNPTQMQMLHQVRKQKGHTQLENNK